MEGTEMTKEFDKLVTEVKQLTDDINNKNGDVVELLNKRVSATELALSELSKSFDFIFEETDWRITSAPQFSVYCEKLPDELWSKFNVLSSLETQKNGGTIQVHVDALLLMISINKQGNFCALCSGNSCDPLDNLKAISKFLFYHRTIYVDNTLLRTWIDEQTKLISFANNIISPTFKCKEIQ